MPRHAGTQTETAGLLPGYLDLGGEYGCPACPVLAGRGGGAYEATLTAMPRYGAARARGERGVVHCVPPVRLQRARAACSLPLVAGVAGDAGRPCAQCVRGAARYPPARHQPPSAYSAMPCDCLPACVSYLRQRQGRGGPGRVDSASCARGIAVRAILRAACASAHGGPRSLTGVQPQRGVRSSSSPKRPGCIAGAAQSEERSLASYVGRDRIGLLVRTPARADITQRAQPLAPADRERESERPSEPARKPLSAGPARLPRLSRSAAQRAQPLPDPGDPHPCRRHLRPSPASGFAPVCLRWSSASSGPSTRRAPSSPGRREGRACRAQRKARATGVWRRGPGAAAEKLHCRRCAAPQRSSAVPRSSQGNECKEPQWLGDKDKLEHHVTQLTARRVRAQAVWPCVHVCVCSRAMRGNAPCAALLRVLGPTVRSTDRPQTDHAPPRLQAGQHRRRRRPPTGEEDSGACCFCPLRLPHVREAVHGRTLRDGATLAQGTSAKPSEAFEVPEKAGVAEPSARAPATPATS